MGGEASQRLLHQNKLGLWRGAASGASVSNQLRDAPGPLKGEDGGGRLCEAEVAFDAVYVEVGAQGGAVRFGWGEEVAALGGGGGLGLGALEGGEVGEGPVYQPQGAAGRPSQACC